MTGTDDQSANTISIVHTNLVAPIIIKNCQEEFQHVSELQEPVIYGRLSDNCVCEHPLIQVHVHHQHTHTRAREFVAQKNSRTNSYSSISS